MPVLPDAPVTRAEFDSFRGEFRTFQGKVALRSDLQEFKDEFRAFQVRLFAHLEGVDRRLDRFEQGLEGVDRRFADQNTHFDRIYSRLTLLEDEYQGIKVGLKRVEDAVTTRKRKPPR